MLDNKNHVFGTSSVIESNMSQSMSHIIGHSDNMKEELQKRIARKQLLDDLKPKGNKIIKIGQLATRASELRSKSVLSKLALSDIDKSLD